MTKNDAVIDTYRLFSTWVICYFLSSGGKFMFIFWRHRVRVKDKKKMINVAEKDWNVMKMLSYS